MEIKMGIDLKPWQEELVKATAGKKPGELVVMMSGRNVGKSILSSMAAYQRMMNDLYNRPVEDLILSEGRIAGSRYHCVEPKGGSWKDMEMWCHEAFGECGEVWPQEDFDWPNNMRWAMNNRKFWFRNEADRTLFIMKWR